MDYTFAYWMLSGLSVLNKWIVWWVLLMCLFGGGVIYYYLLHDLFSDMRYFDVPKVLDPLLYL